MLKWALGIIGGLVVGLGVYAVSALVSLQRLAAAARASDGREVMARNNLPRVRQAIVGQLMTAYLNKVGQTRPLKPFERMAIGTFGASIADDLAAKLFTPENLTSLLRIGAVRDTAEKLEFSGVPTLPISTT